MKDRRLVLAAVAAATVGVFTLNASAADLSGAALANALRKGGCVLVMRHAASPMSVPDKAAAEPDNTKLERQLDQTGKDTARAMGEAFRTLKIPVGAVLSSPTYRARQTIGIAGFGAPTVRDELGDNGRSMAPDIAAGWTAWLRGQANEHPRAGANTILVTHFPNISAAFGDEAKGLADGEMIVFQPSATGAHVVAHIKIEDWPKLAVAR
jgi:phosphohistidine phosphatase SixA